ncbi:MAG TPA: hypothetical protein VH062_02485 [Polyangiaceae bacterium]|nr:hypothetical protein [Polyangiaceae bacterium]
MSQLTGAVTAYRPWSPEEDAALRDSYGKGGVKLALSELGRSRSSVLHRAKHLGVQRRRRWTPEEDTELRMLWGEISVTALAKRLNRTPITTYYRAHEIGLQRGAPAGMEYIRQAADRTGFVTRQLLRILAAARVKPRRTMSRPSKGSAAYRFHFVDPLDVDNAIAAWHATEAVEAAARARGMCGATLREWLRDAKKSGLKLPAEPSPRTRKHWRVRSEVIDQVIEARARLESVDRASKRVGITRQTLCRWLTDAGVPRAQVKPWFVDRDTTDRVVRERGSKRAKPRFDPERKAS